MRRVVLVAGSQKERSREGGAHGEAKGGIERAVLDDVSGQVVDGGERAGSSPFRVGVACLLGAEDFSDSRRRWPGMRAVDEVILVAIAKVVSERS